MAPKKGHAQYFGTQKVVALLLKLAPNFKRDRCSLRDSFNSNIAEINVYK